MKKSTKAGEVVRAWAYIDMDGKINLSGNNQLNIFPDLETAVRYDWFHRGDDLVEVEIRPVKSKKKGR